MTCLGWNRAAAGIDGSQLKSGNQLIGVATPQPRNRGLDGLVQMIERIPHPSDAIRVDPLAASKLFDREGIMKCRT